VKPLWEAALKDLEVAEAAHGEFLRQRADTGGECPYRSAGTLHYNRIYRHMVKPAFVFDGRNILNHRMLYEIGFNVYPVGNRPLVHLHRGIESHQ
jgi:hypothetical protein